MPTEEKYDAQEDPGSDTTEGRSVGCHLSLIPWWVSGGGRVDQRSFGPKRRWTGVLRAHYCL